jgi:hypothetical protein
MYNYYMPANSKRERKEAEMRASIMMFQKQECSNSQIEVCIQVPWRLVKAQLAWLVPSSQGGLPGRGLGMCISNRLPCLTDASVPKTTL